MGKIFNLNPDKIRATLKRRREKMLNPTRVVQFCIWEKPEQEIQEQESFSEVVHIMLKAQSAIAELFKNHFSETVQEFPSDNENSAEKISGFKPIKCLHATIIVDETLNNDLLNYLQNNSEFADLWRNIEIVYDGYKVMDDGCIMLLLKAIKENDNKFLFDLRQRIYGQYCGKNYQAPTAGLDLTNSLWVVLGNLKTAQLSDEQERALRTILENMDAELKQIPHFNLHKLETFLGSKRTNTPNEKYKKDPVALLIDNI